MFVGSLDLLLVGLRLCRFLFHCTGRSHLLQLYNHVLIITLTRLYNYIVNLSVAINSTGTTYQNVNYGRFFFTIHTVLGSVSKTLFLWKYLGDLSVN